MTIQPLPLPESRQPNSSVGAPLCPPTASLSETGSSTHPLMRDFPSVRRPSHWSMESGKAAWERDVSTGKREGVKKRLDPTARAGRGRRVQPISKQSFVPCSAEEWAVRDRGLRILARILARAHLQRYGLLGPGETDATHEVPDSSDEGAFAPDSGITGTTQSQQKQ